VKIVFTGHYLGKKKSKIKRHKFNRITKPIAPVLASFEESYQQTMADNSTMQDFDDAK
jgi:hypothetical protein